MTNRHRREQLPTTAHLNEENPSAAVRKGIVNEIPDDVFQGTARGDPAASASRSIAPPAPYVAPLRPQPAPHSPVRNMHRPPRLRDAGERERLFHSNAPSRLRRSQYGHISATSCSLVVRVQFRNASHRKPQEGGVLQTPKGKRRESVLVGVERKSTSSHP